MFRACCCSSINFGMQEIRILCLLERFRPVPNISVNYERVLPHGPDHGFHVQHKRQLHSGALSRPVHLQNS
ncbi:hypothetical protein M758_12G042200 [Ceratodon purpureus]|nr:hypothetical protein M758_12G041800 [Ceratodon purpureus]KAG0598060.1 hypothetical protein M758_12G042200 [Ceratodon purpureus]